MIDEPKPMKEIHEIREKLYEETKGMTKKELIDYFRKAGEEAAQKYGLKLRKMIKHKRAA
ncbi:MAG: hypothetical protein HZA78_09950 [Candidatus Schekmanbacteria bacterium]|nr:hypothetical protein [Candidatus Schekmanbacteria bacterium]